MKRDNSTDGAFLDDRERIEESHGSALLVVIVLSLALVTAIVGPLVCTLTGC